MLILCNAKLVAATKKSTIPVKFKVSHIYRQQQKLFDDLKGLLVTWYNHGTRGDQTGKMVPNLP